MTSSANFTCCSKYLGKFLNILPVMSTPRCENLPRRAVLRAAGIHYSRDRLSHVTDVEQGVRFRFGQFRVVVLQCLLEEGDHDIEVWHPRSLPDFGKFRLELPEAEKSHGTVWKDFVSSLPWLSDPQPGLTS